MNAVIVFVVLVVTAWILAYRRAPMAVWVVAFGLATALMGRAADGPLAGTFVAVAAVVVVVLVAAAIPPVRRALIVRPVFGFFRRVLPSVSRTEQEALDAGSVWFDGEIFSGAPDFRRLLALDTRTVTDEEQAFIDGPVETLCAMLDEWDIAERRRDLSPEVWDFIKTSGLLGMIIPTRYGGLGFSARAHSEVVMKIASRSATAAVSVMVPNSLGPAELLLEYGTKAQREHYLPRLARGEEIPCFALTSPHAGSDAASIPDYGIVCRETVDGEPTLGIRLNWDKRYITLAPIATLLGLAFRLEDPDGLIGDERDVGITLALIPADHPGVEIGARHFPAGQAFQNGPTRGRDVFVPMSFVIGGQERCGQGWKMLMNCLAAGRSISLPGMSIAALKTATRTSGAYAAVREQFGMPIARFEGIQEPLARLSGQTYVVDAARTLTAAAVDAGEAPAVLSALLKYQATERMRRGVNDAMDIHGGRAICDGPSNYLLGAYKAVPVAITVEGANILTRSLIAFGQGAVRAHPWLLAEIAAAQTADPERGLEAFDHAFSGHVGYAVQNVARALFKNLTLGIIGDDPSVGISNYWFGQLSRASANFCVLADVALVTYGGALKRKEFVSGRFADALGELYLMSAALKRFEDDGRPHADEPIVEYVLKTGTHAFYTHLAAILDNLPSATGAFLLKRLIFPYGFRVKPPSDRLIGRVADLATRRSATRDRLTGGIYLPSDPDDLTGRLETALELTERAAEPWRRVRRWLKGRPVRLGDDTYLDEAVEEGLVTREEAEGIRRRNAALEPVVAVDEFAPGELTRNAADT